jgi:hypothetical protein
MLLEVLARDLLRWYLFAGNDAGSIAQEIPVSFLVVDEFYKMQSSLELKEKSQ